MKNYWKMSDFSLFAVPYAYVDHSSYLADQLFVQNKIRVKNKVDLGRTCIRVHKTPFLQV